MLKLLIIILTTLALAGGLAAQPTAAHLELAGPNGYLWDGACGSGSRDQPVNIVFAGVDSADDLMAHFGDQLLEWDSQGGSVFRFSQDDGSCENQDFQRATAGVISLSRDHIRFKRGHAADTTYGGYYLAAAHHDTLCIVFHEGILFDDVRDTIAAAFESGGHRVDWISVANTDPITHFCTSDEGDGLVAVIWIPPMPAKSPTVSIGSFTATVAVQGAVPLRALDIGAPGLGGWTIDINYDPSVVSAVDCVPQYDAVCNESFDLHTIRLTGTTSIGTPLRGEITLAALTFSCDTAGSTTLALDLQVFIDDTVGAPQPIDAATEEGSITCQLAEPTPPPTPTPVLPTATPPTSTPIPPPTATPEPVLSTATPPTPTPVLPPTATPTPIAPGDGDVNCDVFTNSVDALFVLQLVAGLIGSLPCEDAADVNGDGAITSVDAALILQRVAGLL
ncbi:MAG: hypothetical protein IH865_12995 [Chloroflexi bacterium]|nr:hypothetical protein [Chloroflexota bacterium]